MPEVQAAKQEVEMDDNLRAEMSKLMNASYEHRIIDGCVCALCGRAKLPLSLNILVGAFEDGETTPDKFVRTSTSMGYTHGGYPICNICAPTCKKCKLPIPTQKVLTYGETIGADIGNGICRDIHLSQLFMVIFCRIFKIGRFRTKTRLVSGSH